MNMNMFLNQSYWIDSLGGYMNDKEYQLLFYRFFGISFFSFALNSLWNNITYFNQIIRDVDIINKELLNLKNKCELLEMNNNILEDKLSDKDTHIGTLMKSESILNEQVMKYRNRIADLIYDNDSNFKNLINIQKFNRYLKEEQKKDEDKSRKKVTIEYENPPEKEEPETKTLTLNEIDPPIGWEKY